MNQTLYAPTSVDEISTALQYISPNMDRDNWARIGMAIQSELGEAGFDMFDSWSASGETYKAAEMRSTWRSFKPAGNNDKRPATIATLFKMANDNGYKRQSNARAHAAKQRPPKPVETGAEAAQKRQIALDKAQTFWHQSKPVTSHPYAEKKGLNPERLRVSGDALLVPMFNTNKQLSSVQIIQPDGKKLFMQGCAVADCYFPIGKPTGDTLIIVEGWATGMSIHTATGLAVAVAFSSGNLPKVAGLMREKHPEYRIILAPDNDESRHAIHKAETAARDYGCEVVIPQFPEGITGTDFNDLHLASGLEEVKQQIKSNCYRPEAETTPAPAVPKAVDVIGELALLNNIAYEQCRAETAKDLGVRVSVLDAEVERLRPKVPETENEPFPTPEPWHDPVVLTDLLDEIVDVIHRHVILEKSSAIAIALYVLLTYCVDQISCCTTLAIESPEKRCGKTTLLDLLMRLVYRPIPAANISPAAVYRLIEAKQPTLLIDEADTFLKTNDDIRGILNSGHTRATAVVWRTEEINGERTVVPFSTWGAKVIAQIGQLYETLRDRSIVVSMRRKLTNEKVERLRKKDYSHIPRQAYTWALENKSRIPALEPDTPATLNDRQADGWEPLLAIADLAGGEWPTKARSAAVVLSGGEADTDSIRTQLLTDLYVIFHEDTRVGWSTVELIQKLCERFDDHPWPTYSKGHHITPRQLAALLKPFGLKAKTERRLGSKRGYMTEAFKDSFNRYLAITVKHTLSPADPPNLCATTLHSLKNNDIDDNLSATEGSHVAHKKPLKTAPTLGCSTVADRKGVLEGEHIENAEYDVTSEEMDLL